MSHLKTVEQGAARLALKCLSKKTQDEAPSLVYEVCCSKIVGVDFSRCIASVESKYRPFSNFEPIFVNMLQNSVQS